MQFQAQLSEYEKYASLAQLALGAAHEINNPLLGILSHLELELKNCEDPSDRVEIEQCIAGAKRISSTLRGLLNYATPVAAAAQQDQSGAPGGGYDRVSGEPAYLARQGFGESGAGGSSVHPSRCEPAFAGADESSAECGGSDAGRGAHHGLGGEAGPRREPGNSRQRYGLRNWKKASCLDTKYLRLATSL